MQTSFQHHMIVRQEHLNQCGNLFGDRVPGVIDKVIDKLAFIACPRTRPGRNFVTKLLGDCEFTTPAALGDVLEFDFALESVGPTSVWVRVHMFVCSGHQRQESFNGGVLMACVAADGRPQPLEPETP